jgi:protease-4
MKRGKYVLIIFLIFFFLALATVVSFIYFELTRPPSVQTHSLLEIKLSGEVRDFYSPDFLTSLLVPTRPLSVHDFWMNLKKAKVDRRIDGVLLRMNFLVCDWGKVSELRECLLDFRKSGKKVYAYIEEAPEFDKEYYLATACNRIILHPLGWLGIKGIGGYIPFFKKTLDKLGIEAEFEHVEEFKTAYNMFTEEKFTEAHRTMVESIYGDYFSHYVKTVAAARGKSEEEFRELLDQAFFQGEKALEAGLVDSLLYYDEVEKLFEQPGKKLAKVSFGDYTKISPSSLGLNIGKKIALIYASGPILGGEAPSQLIASETMVRALRKARSDKSVAAVVFRVDSPGGSAVASDVIWREIVLTKKEKPFVVSMSDVAGSGGYWISMAAHKIVAQPQTLTGSIGVIAGKFNLSRFYDKLGITAEKVSYGKRSDIFSSFRKLTSEERDMLKREILWIYGKFLDKVATGRNMAREDVDKIGRGRVWTGNQAKALGLVDEIGGLSRAVELAKGLAGIAPEEEVKLLVWPKKTSFWGAIFGSRDIGVKLPLGHPQLQKIAETASLLEKNRVWCLTPLGLISD